VAEMVLASSARIGGSGARAAAATRMLSRSSAVRPPSSSSSLAVQRPLQRQLPQLQRQAAFHTSRRPVPSTLNCSSPLRSFLPAAQARTLFIRKAPPSPIRSFFTTSLLVAGGIFFVAYYLDSRSAIHRWVAIPFLKTVLDPESAQKLAIGLLASGAAPRDLFEDDEVLKAEVSSASSEKSKYRFLTGSPLSV
jgi:dihydroorotate dehydrogenase